MSVGWDQREGILEGGEKLLICLGKKKLHFEVQCFK